MDLSLQMWKDIPSVIKYHYDRKNFNTFMCIYLPVCHIGAIYAAIYHAPHTMAHTWIWTYFIYYMTGLGVIVGNHRLWSHRSFEASFGLEVFIMLCSSMANEGSIFHWVRDHRVHHKYSETTADPHNATRGFFFSHCGWLLVKKCPETVKAGRELDMSDMFANPVVMWQKKTDPWFNVYMCFFFPAQVASFFWGESFWNAFWVVGFLRYTVVLHFTWLVNSAAHLYGDHPYDTGIYPAENPVVSWLTGGEGWHNWHHKYPFDYATSEFGGLAQYNLGKGAIDFFCWLGIAKNPKKANAAWAMARARRDREKEQGIPLKRAQPRPWDVAREERRAAAKAAASGAVNNNNNNNTKKTS